ncbi:translation initiation factor [Trifolium repens]|nr:translation initiation factor [Trifolium repens]
MLTATSIAMNLRPLSQSSPIPFHNSRQISSLAASTTTTSTAQLRFNLTCHATKEDSSLESKTANTETILHSFSPLPLIYTAALIPGDGAVRSVFAPFVEIVKSLNLPDWLVHWGHPANMAVVLFAMGGYGTYLGFRIRYSDDVEEKAKAKDLHPKLLAGMFFFFALGATGGVTSLLTSDRPIFDSPHAVTGVIGLALLTIQTILPSLFEGNPGLRNVHGILGSSIMTLFLIHAALGLQLGLST